MCLKSEYAVFGVHCPFFQKPAPLSSALWATSTKKSALPAPGTSGNQKPVMLTTCPVALLPPTIDNRTFRTSANWDQNHFAGMIRWVLRTKGS
jgi:hypothetical protein